MALDQFGWKEKEWGTALPVAGNLANMFPFPWSTFQAEVTHATLENLQKFNKELYCAQWNDRSCVVVHRQARPSSRVTLHLTPKAQLTKGVSSIITIKLKAVSQAMRFILFWAFYRYLKIRTDQVHKIVVQCQGKSLNFILTEVFTHHLRHGISKHIQDEAQRALKLLGQGKYDEILEHVHRAPPNDLVFVCTSFPVGMSLQTPLLTCLDAFESAMSEKCEKNPQLLVRVPSMAKLLMAAAEADAQKNVKPFLVMWVTERPVAHSLSDMKDWADTVHGIWKNVLKHHTTGEIPPVYYERVAEARKRIQLPLYEPVNAKHEFSELGEQKDVKTSALASASGSAAPVLTPQASKAQTQPQAQPHAKAQLDPMEVIMAQTLRGNDTNKANEIAAANAKQKYEFLAVK